MFDCDVKFCVNVDYKKDYYNNLHKHACNELVYYLSGEGISKINDVKYSFTNNTFALIGKNTAHDESGMSGTKLVYIGFDCRDVMLEDGLYIDNKGEIGKLMLEIHDEIESKKNLYRAIVNNITEKIILLILRNKKDLNSTNKTDDCFEYILNYINMNFTKNISVQQISKNIGYNYDYFRQVFYKKMHITAKKYILDKKMNYVKDLLINSSYSIDKIADLAGFSSDSHLCMMFKKYEGISPVQYATDKKNDIMLKRNKATYIT